ncbi:hypothetical protein [Halalkalibacter oceani]|uniref:Uncharacterized protein n=1 Tax=Halalkalibacter oceani TaxID=1653776 RepID=A0A9X2DLP0_9BACI|nr:hypothetical protein [Halalkalibacter oceani]MCM3712548.1 hypothetical protein [Halalkalibacter oceani]
MDVEKLIALFALIAGAFKAIISSVKDLYELKQERKNEKRRSPPKKKRRR